jgi:hypothetical protein
MMAAIALADPEAIVVGGTWGREPRVIDALRAELTGSPRQVEVVGSALEPEPEPEFRGARDAGVARLRDLVVADTRNTQARVSTQTRATI